MLKKSIYFLLILVLVFGLTHLTAEEGMYTPDPIKDLNLYDKGLIMKVSDIFNPGGKGLQEAVLLYGGGTSEFVSRDGLILTNHHVAYGAVQSISTAEKNYIKEGFLAKTHEEEIRPNRPYTGRILRLYKDVTKKILDKVKDNMTEEQRNTKIRENTDNLIEKEQKKHKDLELRVDSYYDGNKYYMSGYFVIRDFRIVYVPPVAIGEFGGDIDNWMWPRHTGDFSFMRAYVNKKGEGVPYSEDNVPYKPKVWLDISTDGVKEGDFTFVLGYPGTTFRWRSSYFVEYQMTSQYPYIVDVIKGRTRVIEEESAKDEEVKVQQANTYKGLMNTLKNFEGNVLWYKKVKLMMYKRKAEEQFKRYVERDKKLNEKYGTILDEIKNLYESRKKIDPLSRAMQSIQFSRYAANAVYLYNYSKEKIKPEAEIGEPYKGDALARNRQRILNIGRGLFMPLEKDNFLRGLIRAAKLEGDNKLNSVEELINNVYVGNTKEEKCANIAENSFENTIFNDSDKLIQAFDMSTNELLETGDVFIKIAAEISEKSPNITAFNNDFNGKIARLRRLFTEGMMEFRDSQKKTMYPDANRTFRFAYGYVKGYKPRDAVFYPPFSTLAGVIEKDTGESPFDVPERLKQLYERKDFGKWADPEFNDIVVDFMCDADGTGGNSGSPLLNAEGKIVGCLFDGNWEAITNDYRYMPELTREINVDIRYVLFVAEKFGAGFLLDEMEIER